MLTAERTKPIKFNLFGLAKNCEKRRWGGERERERERERDLSWHKIGHFNRFTFVTECTQLIIDFWSVWCKGVFADTFTSFILNFTFPTQKNTKYA